MIKQLLIGLLILVLGVAAGRYAAPSKTITITQEKIVEKVVEKKVFVKDSDTKVHKVTIRIVTVKPDGTKTIETKEYDNSEIEITQKGSVETDKQTDTSKSTSTTVEYKTQEWLIGPMVKLQDPSYGIFADKRIIGPIYLGGFIFLDKTIGANIGVSF